MNTDKPTEKPPFDFTPRPPGRSFAGKGGLKDWPDEFVCRNCAWAKGSSVTLGPVKPGQKKVWCANEAQQWMWHNSDRACFEEPLEMVREREALSSHPCSSVSIRG